MTYYTAEVVADSPAWWLPLTNYLVDSSGNDHRFTPTPGVRYQLSPLCADGGFAASTHNPGGVNQGMCWYDGILAGLSGASVSFEIWVNVPSSSTGFHGILIGVGTSVTGWAVGVGGTTVDNDGKNLILVNQGTAYVLTGYTFATGVHHLVVTRDGSNNFVAYVDGSSVYSGSFAPSTATALTFVGGYNGNHPLQPNITVDNAAFYASVLTSTRVGVHYAATGSAYATAVLADSPVAFLKFDDPTSNPSSGDTWTDGSGGVNYLDPITGNPAGGSAAGTIFPSCVAFAASEHGSTNIETTTSASEDFTLEFWIKTSATIPAGGKILCAKDDGGGSHRDWAVQINTGGFVTYNVFDGAGSPHSVVSATNIANGAWHHMAFVYDGTAHTIKIYIDGTLNATTTSSFTRHKTNEIIYVNAGDNPASTYLGIDASYHDVAAYASALSAARITARNTATSYYPPPTVSGALVANGAPTGVLGGSVHPGGGLVANGAPTGVLTGTVPKSPVPTPIPVMTPVPLAEQVVILQALQQCSGIDYDFGADLTDIDGGIIRGLATVKTENGTPTNPLITHDSAASVPGTCGLQIDDTLVWGKDIIAPYLIVSSPEYNDGKKYLFPLGLYVATSPTTKLRAGSFHDVTGYDKNYLLQSDVADTFTAPDGSTYTSNIATLLDAAGFHDAEFSRELNPAYISFPSDLPSKIITGDQVFPCDDSNTFQYLDIINQLLAACGCRSIYPDAFGRFTIEYLPDVPTQPQRWVFSGTSTEYDLLFGKTGGYTDSVARTYANDVWGVPNRWVFVQQGLTFQPIEGSGQYTVNNKQGETYYQPPSDQETIGRVITKIVRLNASDQADLVKQGNAIVLSQLSAAATLTLDTAPWPAAAHYDVFQYADEQLPNTNVRKVQAQRWTLPLNGKMMSWTLRVVAFQ